MPENKLKYLGSRIRSARKDCGLTQQELADQTGLAGKTIQDIEQKKRTLPMKPYPALLNGWGFLQILCFLPKFLPKMRKSNGLSANFKPALQKVGGFY